MNNTIINEYPSKCWTCKLARATWATKLEEDGYVGCTYLLDKWLIEKDIDERTEEDLNDFAKFSEIGEARLGWISQSRPLSLPRKGGFFNNQILVRGVISCKHFIPLDTERDQEMDKLFNDILSEIVKIDLQISLYDFIYKPLDNETRHEIYLKTFKQIENEKRKRS